MLNLWITSFFFSRASCRRFRRLWLSRQSLKDISCSISIYLLNQISDRLTYDLLMKWLLRNRVSFICWILWLLREIFRSCRDCHISLLRLTVLFPSSLFLIESRYAMISSHWWNSRLSHVSLVFRMRWRYLSCLIFYSILDFDDDL
jgi:hypothetical protein